MVTIAVLCCCSTLLQAQSKKVFIASITDIAVEMANAKPGDTVILKNGVYTNAHVQFTASGSKAYPILLKAETPGQVFFEGESTMRFSGSHFIVEGFVWQNGGKKIGKEHVISFRLQNNQESSHVTLQQCAIRYFNNSDKLTDNKWVALYGQYNTVRNCLFEGKDNLGATLTVWLTPHQAAYHTIENNYFLYRINGANADNGLESMRIGDSQTSMSDAYCTVQFNRFEGCDGEIEIISNKSGRNRYIGNSFIHSDGGLTLRHGNNCEVAYNYFEGGPKRKAYGVRIIGEGHSVHHNYFTDLHGGPIDKFRAPVTLVNGVPNSPLNGYFQVKNATVDHNYFVNCSGPLIRIGAGRSDAILPPITSRLDSNIAFQNKFAAKQLLQDWVVADAQMTTTNNRYDGRWTTEKGWLEVAGNLLTLTHNMLLLPNDYWPVWPVSKQETGPHYIH